MTDTDPAVRAVRDALLPAAERDLARRPRRRRLAIAGAVAGTLLAGTGVAAATGVLFADPKPNPGVPGVAEWMYLSHDPYQPEPGGPAVLVRPRPEALARTNRATERELLERGVTARCGSHEGHPLACYLPSGDPVDAEALNQALTALDGEEVLESSRDHYEIRPLSEAEAKAWLCEHPDQRPSGRPADC